MELSLRLLLPFMPRMCCGSIGLLLKMSEQLLAALPIFLNANQTPFFPHFVSRQHRPYPKEGAWHRLRHFTLAALRFPSDAMNLNYNPGPACPHVLLCVVFNSA